MSLDSNLQSLATEIATKVKVKLTVTAGGDITIVSVNGKAYYPIYPPGTTPASGDPSGLDIETA